MEVSVSNADRYWNLLKDLSNEMKLDLIARLSNSMRQEKRIIPYQQVDFMVLGVIWIAWMPTSWLKK